MGVGAGAGEHGAEDGNCQEAAVRGWISDRNSWQSTIVGAMISSVCDRESKEAYVGCGYGPFMLHNNSG